MRVLNYRMVYRSIAFLLCLAASTAIAEVVALPGSSPQRALVRDVLPNPVRVRVLDGGTPVANARVDFQTNGLLYGGVGSSDGRGCRPADYSQVCEATTNADGVAEFRTLTSYWAGTHILTVGAVDATGSRSYGYVEVVLKFDPRSPPMQLKVLSGGDQYVKMGTQAPEPIRVQLLTFDGRPVLGTQVEFEPRSEGPDWVGFRRTDPVVLTGAAGGATSPPIFAGWGVGTHQLQISAFDPDAGALITVEAPFTVVNERGQPDLDLTNMWWAGVDQNGWGMSIVKHGRQLFNVLYVYDAMGNPSWFVQPGGEWRQGVGSQFVGPVYAPRSASWFAYDASRMIVGPPVGYLALEFKGAQRGSLNGLIAFDLIEPGLAQTFFYPSIKPQDFAVGSSPITGVADMWWGGPEQNGWGISVHQQAGNLFMVWFTYGADGKATWFVMPGGTWTDMGSYSGTIYRTFATDWLVGPYDASKLQSTAIGKYTIRFTSADRATFTFIMDGASRTLDLRRQAF